MKAGAFFAVICLVLAGVLAGAPTRDVLPGASVGRKDLPFERNLNDLRAGELVRVNLSGNGINVWSALELELSDPEDEVLFSTTRAIEYYRGRDADGNWSEGSNRARLTFRAPYDGDYTLSVAAEDDEGYRASGGPKPKAWTTLYISATAGHRVWGWMTLASALFLMAAGWPFWQMWRHNERRWRGSDWVDESDD